MKKYAEAHFVLATIYSNLHKVNDFGQVGFGGACPPEGHGIHRYQFTIYALSEKLDLPENASGALTGYMVKAHALASSTIEALYQRCNLSASTRPIDF